MVNTNATTSGHIGEKRWKRLTRRQREAIKRDRANAAKHASAFIREKDKPMNRTKKS